MKNSNQPQHSYENMEAVSAPLADSSKNYFEDSFPVLKLKQVYQSIDLYKKLITISILANTILVLMGVIYL